MQFHLSLATALAMALAASTPAQVACPMQTTQHVAGQLTRGPEQDCGTIEIQIIDLPGQPATGRCPTWVHYVPPHDIAIPTPNLSYVDVIGTHPITLQTFECRTRTFLFVIPVGSNCVAGRIANVGAVYSMVARPCSSHDG